jgi:hypothetical protein
MTSTRLAALTVSALLLSLGAGQAAAQLQPRFGAPVPGLTPTELARFNTGLTNGFQHSFLPAEGLGPTFNNVSCAVCHADPVAGGSSNQFVTRFGLAPSGPNGFDPLDGSGPSGLSLGGSLLQADSINSLTCNEFVPTIAGGFPVDATIEIHRFTPGCFGFGLVEAIDDNDILYLQNNPPHAWISGFAHNVTLLEDPLGPTHVGRFGWKSQVATMLSFSGDASLNEMGITNDLVMSETAANGDAAKLAACDTVAEPEDVADGFGFRKIDRMTDFQRFLGVPPQVPASGMTGEALFVSVGCADCHKQSFTTKNVGVEAALAGKTIRPYSDFLLHDIGTGDGIIQGQATGDEFRTALLWGVRVREPGGLLHDGRGVGFADTIDQHLGEASTSRSAYFALSAGDQQKLLDFLGSLGQREFDADDNNAVDAIDWLSIQPNVTGPGSFFTPDSPSAISDVDQDGDFDLIDIGYLQRAHTN